jgi:hypothetical protein
MVMDEIKMNGVNNRQLDQHSFFSISEIAILS